MAEKQTNSSPGPSTLQRGKACLRCRKRKMRCDGVKPACQQCVRAKKADGCEYDDGKGKTRTQLMREHIARLELRIKDLESHDHSSPSVTLFDPHAPGPSSYCGSSSSSSYSSPAHISMSASGSPAPFPPEVTSPSNWDAWDPLNDFSAANQAYGSDEPSYEVAHSLLNYFLPHRKQCGLELHVGRLRESLDPSSPEKRHPVLMNAIFLWACYMNRPTLQDDEPVYLSRALAAVNDALQYPSKVVDLVQGTCLLSVYYLSNGRLFEGSYHATVAASLAVQAGLHQLGADERMQGAPGAADALDAAIRLPPPKDAVERGERVCAFWQAYNLDRCWSVALQRPATIPDGEHPWACITTPWPQSMDEYGCGDVHIGAGPTVRRFFVHQGQMANELNGYSTTAFRAKASALFEAASRAAAGWSAQVSALSDSLGVLEHTIARFMTTLVPLSQLAATTPEEKLELIVVHSFAHASLIRLHTPFVDSDPLSREKCVRAARSIAYLASIADSDLLDPVVGICWSIAARVVESELLRLESSWPPLNTTEMRSELVAIVMAMSRLGARFPLLGYQATKIQNFLESK